MKWGEKIDERQHPRRKTDPGPVRCFTGFSKQSTGANAPGNIGAASNGRSWLIGTASYKRGGPGEYQTEGTTEQHEWLSNMQPIVFVTERTQEASVSGRVVVTPMHQKTGMV
jgi:hypothetical protein